MAPPQARGGSMTEKLLLPDIRELIQAGDLGTLAEFLSVWLPADLAGLLIDLSSDERLRLLRALVPHLRADVVEYLPLEVQEELLQAVTRAEAAEILNEMVPDDRTALLEELPSELSQQLLSLLSPGERAVAESLLQYDEDSVGRLMTTDYIAVRESWTIKRVLDYIRVHGKDSETLNVVYVVDDEGRLVDDLRIREVLLAALHLHVREIMDRQVISLPVTMHRGDAVGIFRKYDRSALPVVDSQERLAGIVTIDDVMDVAEEEATRELQRFGGVEALEEPYVSTPLPEMIRKRASWLVVLFIGEMLTATAMGFFEDEIKRAVVLSLFVPLIISSGGNSGSQAATLIIRALALGEIKLREWGRVFLRELLSGIALGLILGSIGFLRIALWRVFFPQIYGPHWSLIGLTVALSLVGVVLWGTLSGAMLPFLLKRLGLDPATSSAPFVATLVDVIGLLIYFTVAVLLLRGTLL